MSEYKRFLGVIIPTNGMYPQYKFSRLFAIKRDPLFGRQFSGAFFYWYDRLLPMDLRGKIATLINGKCAKCGFPIHPGSWKPFLTANGELKHYRCCTYDEIKSGKFRT